MKQGPDVLEAHKLRQAEKAAREVERLRVELAAIAAGAPEVPARTVEEEGEWGEAARAVWEACVEWLPSRPMRDYRKMATAAGMASSADKLPKEELCAYLQAGSSEPSMSIYGNNCLITSILLPPGELSCGELSLSLLSVAL